MELLNLIFPIIVTIIAVALAAISSIERQQVLKVRIIFSALLVFFTVAVVIVSRVMFPDEKIYETIYLYVVIVDYLWLTISILATTIKTSGNKNHYSGLVSSLDKTEYRYFYSVDQNEKIRDISQSFLKELNLTKEEVIGKKMQDVFGSSLRFISINELEMSNSQVFRHYESFRERSQEVENEIETISFYNFAGEKTVLEMVNQAVKNKKRYLGRMSIGQVHNQDGVSMKNRFGQGGNEYQSLQQKFIATMEVSKEGLFTLDLNTQTMWLSNALVQLTNLPTNTLDVTEFRSIMEPSDLEKYLEKLGKLSASNINYRVKYRMMIKGVYVWFEERGKRIFEDPTSSTILGSINPLPTKHFMNSNIPELNDLKSEDELMVSMNYFLQDGKYFQLVVLRLANIPKINEEHSREVSNLIMGEYIRKINQTFASEGSGLYRLTGTTFALLITDLRKMDLLRKGLTQDPTFLNLNVNYGALELELKVHAGITTSKEGTSEQQLMKNAKAALSVALNPEYRYNGFYYEDLSK